MGPFTLFVHRMMIRTNESDSSQEAEPNLTSGLVLALISCCGWDPEWPPRATCMRKDVAPRTATVGDTVDLVGGGPEGGPLKVTGAKCLSWVVPSHTSTTLRNILAFTSSHTNGLLDCLQLGGM